jgi:hypothetical protein
MTSRSKRPKASLLQRLLEARDFVLQARNAARDRKVVHEKDGPDGEIRGHQAIEIFHWASILFTPKKRLDVHGFFGSTAKPIQPLMPGALSDRLAG